MDANEILKKNNIGRKIKKRRPWLDDSRKEEENQVEKIVGATVEVDSEKKKKAPTSKDLNNEVIADSKKSTAEISAESLEERELTKAVKTTSAILVQNGVNDSKSVSVSACKKLSKRVGVEQAMYLVILIDLIDGNDQICLGQPDLAEHLSVNYRSVSKIMDKMISNGLVELIRGYDVKTKKCKIYKVLYKLN